MFIWRDVACCEGKLHDFREIREGHNSTPIFNLFFFFCEDLSQRSIELNKKIQTLQRCVSKPPQLHR